MHVKVYLGADHRGFKLAEEMYQWLVGRQIVVVNVTASKLDPDDDYVDYAKEVAQKVAQVKENGSDAVRGIVICGSGIGVDMVANKFEGVRCGLGFSESEIKAARQEDDINVLALPADSLSVDQAKNIVRAFLETDFDSKKRHQRRLDKLTLLEEELENN